MKSPGDAILTIFGLEIKWYGFLIALAFAIAIVIVTRRAPRHGIHPDKILDFALITIPAGIIGARIYYVLFNWAYYAAEPAQILNLRGGGLAIHGGLIFGLTAGALLCRLWKIEPLNGLDLAVPTVALGQAIGRWGNFFNEEAYGGPTSLPWGLDIDGVLVHPTFLYESIWTFGLFLFLSYVDRRRKFTGQVLALYSILYSFERFFIEGLRTDSLMLGSLRVAQIISVLAFAAGIAAYLYLQKKSRKTNQFSDS